MKRYFFILPLVAAMLSLGACKSNESYRHSASITYPVYNEGFMYADQTQDSIKFTTFDSYQVASYNTTWLAPNANYDPISSNITNSYYYGYIVKVGLTAQANTTGACRYGFLQMHSWGEDDWDQTLTATYYQLYWSNILHPSASITYNSSNIPVSCAFESKDSANQVVDTLRFNVYDTWKVTIPEGSFIKAADTIGTKGTHTVILTMEPNTETKERSTTLKLTTGNGVTTDVTYRQDAAKQE